MVHQPYFLLFHPLPTETEPLVYGEFKSSRGIGAPEDLSVLTNSGKIFLFSSFTNTNAEPSSRVWMLYLSDGHILSLNWLWVALCVATKSNAWLSTAVLVTNMRNFPISRGTVAGILKGNGGLSAAVFTEVYSTVLHRSSANLLLFLAPGIPILCFAMMYFVRPCIPSSVETSVDHGHFLFIQVASVVLGIYVLTTTILGDTFSFNQEVSFAFLLVMVILLMAPLAIPLKLTLYPLSHSKPGIHSKIIDSSDDLIEVERNVDKTEPFLTPSTSTANLASFHDRQIYVTKLSALSKLFRWETGESLLLAVGEGAVKKRRPRRGDDFKFTEALVKAVFWLLFMVYFVGVGSGVNVLNNLAQIGIAQGVHNMTLVLSIFSFGNFVGRLEALCLNILSGQKQSHELYG